MLKSTLTPADIKSEKIKEIQKITKLLPDQIVEELFVSSLVPEGKLSSLLFPKTRKWTTSQQGDILERTRKEFADRMNNHVKKRWDETITIKEFIKAFNQELTAFLGKK